MPREPDNFGSRALQEYREILKEYQHRQRLRHMAGPAISLLLHIVLIVAAFYLIVLPREDETTEVEVTLEELDVKEIEPKMLEELEELEEKVDEVVPTVARPDVPTETAVDVAAAEDMATDVAGVEEMDVSSLLDVQASDTALKVPSLYAGRKGSGRKRQRERYGGSVQAERAVLKALRWLKEHQNADGSWSNSQKDAMAGLGLLTFLAHGEVPESEEFGPTVQKAMDYLTRRMMAVPESEEKGLVRAYVNGIVTYALCEAYGITKLPFLKPPMERGLGFIIRGQQENGGWNYNYNPRSHQEPHEPDRWDLSVSGWQVQALKAGYVAGANVPGLFEAIEKSIDFVKNVTYKDGEFGYSSPGDGSWGMQGAGTLALQLLGEGRARETREGIENIAKNAEVKWKRDGQYKVHANPTYNWYYLTQAMFHAGRRRWRHWNDMFAKELIRNQKPDGHWECPGKQKFLWKDPKSGKMKTYTQPEYDPYYSTTLCCLSLQVYYRYLPTYKMPEPIKSAEKSVFELDEADLGLEFD